MTTEDQKAILNTNKYQHNKKVKVEEGFSSSIEKLKEERDALKHEVDSLDDAIHDYQAD